jgi:hypothetical protein
MNAVVEIPRRHQGAQRFQIASQADRCVAWLRAQGFDVLAIQAGPRITIRYSDLCEQLEGVVEGYQRTPKGETRYKMASRFDCAVVWIVSEVRAKRPALSLFKRAVQSLCAMMEVCA